MNEEDVSILVTEDIRVRIAPCDGCGKRKLIGWWNKIIAYHTKRFSVFYACSSACQFKVLRERV